MRSHGMGLLVEMLDCDSKDEKAVRAWIDEDHMGRLLSVPSVCGAAAYEAIKGSPRFLNLYEAENVQDFYGKDFEEIVSAPSERDSAIKDTVIFKVRLVCAQIYPGLPPSSPSCPTVEISGLPPIVQFGRIFVPPENISDFNGWYAQDRTPLAEKVPGVRRVRRYVPVEGDPVMVVLYELESETVFETPEWKSMNSSSWTAKVRSYYRQAEGSPGVYRRRGYAH